MVNHFKHHNRLLDFYRYCYVAMVTAGFQAACYIQDIDKSCVLMSTMFLDIRTCVQDESHTDMSGLDEGLSHQRTANIRSDQRV